MNETEDDRSSNERAKVKCLEGNLLEVFLHDVAVNKGTKKCFFDRRNDEGAAEDARDDDGPGEGGAGAELFVRVPEFWWYGFSAEELVELWIERVQSDPNNDDTNADEDGFDAEGPAHFFDGGPHRPDEPDADDGFGEVKPIFGRFAEFSLERGERDENDVGRDASNEWRAAQLGGECVHVP